jgi:hypothetical protein
MCVMLEGNLEDRLSLSAVINHSESSDRSS